MEPRDEFRLKPHFIEAANPVGGGAAVSSFVTQT